MSDIAIRVENLSKQYRLGLVGSGTLSHDLNRLWHRVRGKDDPYLKLGETNDRTVKGMGEYVWALRDINFDVKAGEVLGIIGRNGAGKSTLLKILSKVTTPTTGKVHVQGRIASLLEVGTGFHPELTGRENIFLNGAILGMTKSEIKSKFDEIVDFSGVERYIDTPVKRYSSGMYVRLAFAVAAHLEPEILIVDEVLAVGDAEFQKKCMGKIQNVSTNEGRTVLFVSHNMGAIRGLCTRAILFQNGSIEKQGDVNSVISQYLLKPLAKFDDLEDSKDNIVIKSIELKNKEGRSTQDFATGEEMTIVINYFAKRKYTHPYFWISIYSQLGATFTANMLIDGRTPEFVEGEGSISCTFKKMPLVPQLYSIWIGVRNNDGKEVLTASKEAAYFNITHADSNSVKSEYADLTFNDSCPVLIDYAWELPDGKREQVVF